MEKSLLDQLNYYYTKNEDQIFYQFKTENKDYLFTSQYLNYFKKCQDIIDSLESKNIEVSLDKLKNSINEMTNKLNETTRIMKDLQKAEKNFQNKAEEKGNEEFASIYAKEAESILSKITENLSKIRKSTYSSEFEMMSDAKKINNSKTNELKLQQLKNTLTENLKSFQYSLKEKNSKIVSVENKQNTLNDNKLKIEKLKQEFNSNSERMAKELAENEKCQNELDAVLHELDKFKKEDNTDEQKEGAIKDEQNKFEQMCKDNEISMGELMKKKIKAEENLEKKRKDILGILFLNYYLLYKIHQINNVNNYNYCLKQKLEKLKELSNKLGIKSAKVQEETNKVDKRFIKYQLFLQGS